MRQTLPLLPLVLALAAGGLGFGAFAAQPGGRAKPPVRVSCASVEFGAPASVALSPEGWLLVADPGRGSGGAAHLLDEEGNLLLTFRPASAPAGFAPSDFVCAPDGRFAANDPQGGRVLAFGLDGAPAGEFACRASDGSPRRPDRLAVAPDGRWVVLDAARSAVLFFAPDGKSAGGFGAAGGAPGEFDGAAALAVAADGRILVADRGHGVQVFDAQGKFLMAWPGTKSATGAATGLALDGAGCVQIAGPGPLVRACTPAGTVVEAALPAGARPGGLAASADGWRFVADACGAVLRLDPEGKVVQEIGKPTR